MEEKQRRKLRHDILGSLNSIKLSTEVIKVSKDREELLMFLECIVSEVTKMEEMVDTLVERQPGSAANSAAPKIQS